MIYVREVEVEGRRLVVVAIDLGELRGLDPKNACYVHTTLAESYYRLMQLLEGELVYVDTSFPGGPIVSRGLSRRVAEALADAVEMLLRGEGLERLEERYGRWAARRATSLLRRVKTVVKVSTGVGSCYSFSVREVPERLVAVIADG